MSNVPHRRHFTEEEEEKSRKGISAFLLSVSALTLIAGLVYQEYIFFITVGLPLALTWYFVYRKKS